MEKTKQQILEQESGFPDREVRRHSGKTVLCLLGLCLLLGIVGSFLIGRYPVPLKELMGILWGRTVGLFGGEVQSFWTDAMEAAVWNVRLPRVLMSVLVGGCLSAAGAAYQGVFQNPIASPDILGASAGAGFGAALAILFGLSSLGITLMAFAMSLMTVILVFWIGRRVKGERAMGLILAGIMIGSLFQSGTSFIKLVADPSNKLPLITYWLMGSLSGAKWSELAFVIFPMGLGLAPLLLLRWRMNILAMGDDEARAMGVNTERLRIGVIVCATLVTAASVSVSGMIGWVGLVIPHMMRRLVGSDQRWLMPASILGGGLFLLVVDTISRNAFQASIPIGILTAFIGAPFFLYLVTGRSETR